MWGKQLWASEDYSTLNDDHGARCSVTPLYHIVLTQPLYFRVHYSSTLSNVGEYMWGKQLWASEDYPSLVLVQPRKTRPYIT